MGQEDKNEKRWSWGPPIKSGQDLYDLLQGNIDLDIAPIKWAGYKVAEGVEQVEAWMVARGFCAMSMRDDGYRWMRWDKTLPEVPPSRIMPEHADVLWERMRADAVALELSEIGGVARSSKLAPDLPRRSI